MGIHTQKHTHMTYQTMIATQREVNMLMVTLMETL